MKYAPADSTVSIRIGNDPTPYVTVCDHGPGGPRDEIDQRAKRFKRGQNVRGTIGPGLGLTIARDVIAAHNGDLQLTNPSEGGACVLCFL